MPRTVFQGLPDAGACEGAQQQSCAAQRRHAADDARRHTVHLVRSAGFHVAHARLSGQDQAHHEGAEGADQVNFGGGGKHIHAGELGRFHIGADGVNVPAGAGLGHDEEYRQKIIAAIQKALYTPRVFP